MPDRLITVVIVHWNQPERVAATLACLGRQDAAVRVLVIDNGSGKSERDRLVAVVAASDLDVALVDQGANTGFGPAANAGFRRWLTEDDGEWVALLPHDALPADGTLSAMVEAAEARPHAGLACADVGDGHIPVIDPYFGGLTMPAPDPDHRGWERVDYPHGTLLVARRACLLEIGLFDERYFAYCEEADLGRRAEEAGWEVGLIRGARVTNPSMRSGSPAVDYLMQRNTLLLVREHSGRYHASIRFGIGCWQLLRGLVRPSRGTFVFSARGRALGMLDFLRGRFGPPPNSLFSEAGDPPAGRADRGAVGSDTDAHVAPLEPGSRPSSAAATTGRTLSK